MANKQRGEVSIKLDKIRKLKFTHNALEELDNELGYCVTKLDPNNVTIKVIIRLLWASLLHDMPNLTIKESGDLMDYSNLKDVSEAVIKALQLAFGDEENQEALPEKN